MSNVPEGLEPFRSFFNRQTDVPRLVLIVSPT